METLAAVLPILIYILLIILLVVGIILGIKVIITIDKVNDIIDDVNAKVKSLDGIFSVVSVVSNKLAMLSSKITDLAVSLISKIVGSKKGKDDDYE